MVRKMEMSVKIICPYVNDNEIVQQKNRLWNLPVYFEKDHARIGSDMMYQKLWNKFSNAPGPYPKKIKFLNSINPNFIISNLDISLISPESAENSSFKK